jgi:zinc protease
MRRPTVTTPPLLAALALAACGGAPTSAPETPTGAASQPIVPPVMLASAPAPANGPDVGPRPTLAAAPSWQPEAPQVLTIPGLPPVWLIERHTLPMVSVEVVVRGGAADDPPGRAGACALTAEMMEQGAGRYGALEIARLFEQLGAEASVDAGLDGSSASLTVLKPNLRRALELFADVIARPRFEAAEWKRAQSLWLAQLEQRPFEPADVASVVARAVHFGAAHPYGHPVDGHLDTVGKLKLDDVRGFHRAHWRPDAATLIVAGDVTPEELKTVFAPAFAGWVAPAKRPAPAPAVASAPNGPRPRTVLVERPDAAQTMFLLVAQGPESGRADLVAHELGNIPLGGSFTSRLNSNLREDKGYTYGVRSSVDAQRLAGRWSIRTAVHADATGPALREILKEVDDLAATGPTPEELRKARASAWGDVVSTYESLEGVTDRLAELAVLGLPAEEDRRRTAALGTVPDADIVAATRGTALRGATIIAVGDGARIRAAFSDAGLPAPALHDADGRPLASKAAKTEPPAAQTGGAK